MRPTQLLLGTLAMLGCGRAPLNLPQCEPAVSDFLCAPSQTRNGMRCATCTDADSTLTCQTSDYEAVLCVSDCSACDSDPGPQKVDTAQVLAVAGVHVCGYDSDNYDARQLRKRGGAYCAICSTQDLSAAFDLCSTVTYSTGLPGAGDTQTTTICDPVVCVHDCNSCALPR